MVYANHRSVEVVDIADIVHGQFEDALVGVDAVIHTASPLPGRMDPQDMLNSFGLPSIDTHANNVILVDCDRGFFKCFTARK